jgi:hypothetical protein
LSKPIVKFPSPSVKPTNHCLNWVSVKVLRLFKGTNLESWSVTELLFIIYELGSVKSKVIFCILCFRALSVNGSLCSVIPGALILRTVVIKFIAPKIEEIPERCKLNIARSTEAPECDCIPDRGG